MRIRLGHMLAVLALCFQLAMPGVMATAHASGIDASRYLCAPSGDIISNEAQAAAEQIASLLGETPEPNLPASGHCDACTLGHSPALPAPAFRIEAPVTYESAPSYPPYALGFSYAAQGPPNLSRGPPALK